jgi:hypothetical protein
VRRSASGSTFAENPRRDAREAEPSWSPISHPTVHLVDVPDEDAPRFDLWSFRGVKQLAQDGRGLSLINRSASSVVRATLGRGVEPGCPFGVWCLDKVGRAEGTTERLLQRRPGRATPLDRTALAHLRALFALDAKAVGASDQQIGAALTLKEHLARTWSPDSALRALVRDALKRGRSYRDRRWPELVWPGGRRPLST